MTKFKWNPVRSIEECDRIIMGPGQFHEMEHAIIDGAVYKVYKNLWPSLRHFWLSLVTNNRDIHAREYIVFEDFRLTYGQADELVQRAASVFRETYGVRKGDRIGIAMRNYPEWIISFFAAGLLGAIPTLFNAWLPLEPFLHCIKTTTPKLMVLDRERFSIISPQLQSLRLPVIIVRSTSQVPKDDRMVKEWSSALSEYSGSTKAWAQEPDPLPDDPATIFFTSGTTGFNKAVLSSHRGFLSNFFNSMLALRRREMRLGQDLPPPFGAGPAPEGVQEQSAGLIAVPLFHVTGSTGQMIGNTVAGGKIVLMRKWEKEEAASLIVKEKISTFAGVPSLAYDLMDSSLVGNTDFVGIGIGGAPAAETLVGEMVQKFPNLIMQQGYGSTETNSLSVSVFGEDYLARPGSTGLPVGGVELLVVDPNTNKVLPRGQVGELWIRGPNVMLQYFNNPKATEEAITRHGWFKSGDLGSIDEEGFVYIKDRVKDMIIRGGENIHSATVENAFFADARVLDCAAVGIPDKRLGELVGIVVVPRKDSADKLREEDLLQEVKERLPAYAVPSIILIRNNPLERNASGKVLKQELKKAIITEWERRGNVKSKL